MATKYVPIRVSTLRGDQKITFNAYVKVAGKYILFCREGDSFEGERLERLHNKNLQKMYIPSEQAHLYDRYIKENISRAYDSSQGKSIEERALIIEGALQGAAEDLIEDLQNEALYRITLEGAQKFSDFITTEEGSLQAILNIKNEDHNIAHHGVTVAGLALALADEMGFKKEMPMRMATLATGCLVHDLEHHYTPVNRALLEDDMSENEVKLYRRHSIDGARRVRDIHFYDPLVADIVEYHDEHIDGTGVGQKREKDIDILVFVAATANVFEHLVSKGKMDPKDALKKMLIDKMGALPLDCLKALQEVLKKRGIVV